VTKHELNIILISHQRLCRDEIVIIQDEEVLMGLPERNIMLCAISHAQYINGPQLPKTVQEWHCQRTIQQNAE
jgi:hypothetical protein